jgi:hypothetical protein
MAKIEMDAETSLAPDQVIGMLTDFSDQRPAIWPGLWEGAYKVYSVGETSAEIREGNKKPKIWARERYDWSKPGVVRWEVIESNFCKPGSFVEAKVQRRDDGGSRVHITWSRSPTSLVGMVALVMIVITRGAPVKASMTSAFKRAESKG